MSTPSFTDLVDWVDDRLGARHAAAVARLVAQSPDARSTVDWISQFRDAGHSLPLADVPESLSRDLRAAFRRYRAPRVVGIKLPLIGDEFLTSTADGSACFPLSERTSPPHNLKRANAR